MIELINLSHSFADRLLYADVNLTINDNDKIGLVGPNGSGKSTLIDILTEKIVQDKGIVNKKQNCKIGYIDQYIDINKQQTIYELLLSSFENLIEIEEEYNEINLLLSNPNTPNIERLLIKSQKLLDILILEDYYNIDSKILKFASGLGISVLGMNTKLENLSGGQLAKCLLCKVLLEKPDVFILDEPTNHLDVSHIEWLTNFLASYDGAVLIVSHNTNFLNEVCNIIWSIEFNEIYPYKGNYNQFLKQHAERVERQEKSRVSLEKKKDILKDFIARKSAKTCFARMAQSKKKQLEKMEDIVKLEELPTPNYVFKYKPIKTSDVIFAKNITIGYNKPLIKNISIQLKLGDKICITGFNGLGKSTLIKTLLGEISPFDGTVKKDDKISVGYFEQNLDWEDENITALEEIRNCFQTLTEKDARGYLAKAGLTAKHLTLPIKKLSGGEQSKIKLCKLMIYSYNVLIFDEPTNHLDVKAKQALAKAINAYQGSVIFVSHEKSFAKEIIAKEINLEKMKIS